MELKNRFKKVLTVGFFVLTVGVVYTVVCLNTELRIPCIFRLVTGFKCPGCGVTGMMLSLFKGDLASAFRHNGAILMMLPVGVALAVDYLLRYIKSGEKMLTKPSRAVVIIMISVLLIFGVIRNFSSR